MATTTEDLSLSLIRTVPQKTSVCELLLRGFYATRHFLDITRVTEQSTALKLQEEILEDHSIISCFNKSLRSNLVGFIAVRDKSIKKFTTIKIHLDNEDYIKVNTMWSNCIGNQYIYQIGPYGDKGRASVLQALQEVLGGRDEREPQKVLFVKLTDCVKKGVAISEDELLEINPKLQILEVKARSLIRSRLLAFTYLVYYLEITRRPKHEESAGYKNGSASKNKTILCCEGLFDAWTKVLELLKRGILSIEQVFAANAPYGLPTGKGLRNENDVSLTKKYEKINDLYMQTLYPIQYKQALQNGQTIIPSMEEIHLRLKANSTSIQESPGKPYITPCKKTTRIIDATDLPLPTKLFEEANNVEGYNISLPIPLLSFPLISETTKKRLVDNGAEESPPEKRKKVMPSRL